MTTLARDWLRRLVPFRVRRWYIDRRFRSEPADGMTSLDEQGIWVDQNSLDVLVFGYAGDQAYEHEGHRYLPVPANTDFASLQRFLHAHAVEEAVCLVRRASWTALVSQACEYYGWQVVNDIETPTASPALISSDAWTRITASYGRVSIIIVSYNGLELVQTCVDSILRRTIYPNFELIIVDNNSEGRVKDYLKELKAREPRVRVILNSTNLGFAAANNIGLRHASESEFVVLLNNDTVAPRGWLSRLVRHARRPDIGLVGPVTNWTGNEARIPVPYRNGSDLPAMERFARGYTYAHEGHLFDIRTLAMFCVLTRRSVIDEVGLLDEQFGQGMFEDEDFARRVRQHGYRVVCAEDAYIHHVGMASFSKLAESAYRELFERNKRLYEAKWGEPWVPYQARARVGKGDSK